MPAELVGIAVLVAPITQLLKRLQPPGFRIHGWRALGLNFTLCLIAKLGTCAGDPGQIQHLPFWVSVVEATLIAAGVHGTGKGLGLFSGVFSLPEEDKDPLGWQCPHMEMDGSGRPVAMCNGVPGQECSWR